MIAPVAKRALVTAPPVVKDLPVTAPSRDRPREDGDRPARAPGRRQAPRWQAGGKPGFGKPSFAKSGERGERSVSQARAKAPVVPVAASRAAKARVANLLEAGE